jgi:hypothetical protein
MGGIQQISDSDWVAWTGGKPIANWMRLDKVVPDQLYPSQYRPSSVGSSAKARHYRTIGLETKFSRTGNLQVFQREVMEHLQEHGMDTITYLPDPTDTSKMISIVEHHARFSYDEAESGEVFQKARYDRYDKENMRDGKAFLGKSIDEDLKEQLYDLSGMSDTFIMMWMNLIGLVQSVSIDWYDKIKMRLKQRRIKNYAGEDVMALSSDYLSDWKELHGARMYEQTLTLHMLRQIMTVGSEDFLFPLRKLKEDLSKALLDIRHLGYQEAHETMVKKKVDVKSVLKKANEEYRSQKDEGLWAAAAHAKDSKALNRNYGSVNAVKSNPEQNQLNKLVNALVQRIGGNN